jgi:hypothetical protein
MKDTALSENGTVVAGLRHGMCELAFNTAGERHGMCESAFNAPRGLGRPFCQLVFDDVQTGIKGQ